VALSLALAALTLPFAAAPGLAAGTLDRIKGAGKITLGYRTDARPFSFGESGAPAGYSIALCQKVADQVKADLGLSSLALQWTPVTLADRFSAVQQGKIDLLCGGDTVSLSRRKDVSFSIPIFASGIGVLLRADAPAALRVILAVGQPPDNPVWRGSPARTVLNSKTFSVVSGTTGPNWLAGRINAFQVDATVAPVESYDAGIKRVLDRSSDVLFGDRSILIEAADRSAAARDLVVLPRLFTYEPLALALARNDDDFRLTVDRALSGAFASKDFEDLYVKWFGEPSDLGLSYLQMGVFPE
jgi:polar amino acid transport system substrate-binding protein